jgi:hypothetical protein
MHLFVKNMSKDDVQAKIFYPKTMENFLFVIIRNGGYQECWRKIRWLNAQNVERTFLAQENHGKWLDVQTGKEKECSWKSDFSTVLNVRNPSE